MGIKRISLTLVFLLLCSSFALAENQGVSIGEDFRVTIFQGNLTNFTDLQDTPGSYAGQANKCVSVNGIEDTLEFIACSLTNIWQRINGILSPVTAGDNLSIAGGNITADYYFGNGSALTDILSKDATWLVNWSKYNETWTSSYNQTTNDSINNNIDSKLTTIFYNATNVNAVTGTPSGTVELLQVYNSTSYNISEDGSDMELIVNFTGITEFNQLIVRYKSSDTESHTMAIQIWSYTDSDWEDYRTVGNTENVYNIFTMSVFDDDEHVDGGTVQVRFYTDNLGAQTHLHQFDWVAISSGPATPSSDETDPFSIHSDGNVPLEANWGQGAFNFTDTSSWFLGSVLWENVFGLNTSVVPYVGATKDVDLGEQNLTVDNITIGGRSIYWNGTALRIVSNGI